MPTTSSSVSNEIVVMDVDEQIATDMVNEALQEQYQRQNGRNTCLFY